MFLLNYLLILISNCRKLFYEVLEKKKLGYKYIIYSIKITLFQAPGYIINRQQPMKHNLFKKLDFSENME
jgi:hypothetical protein